MELEGKFSPMQGGLMWTKKGLPQNGPDLVQDYGPRFDSLGPRPGTTLLYAIVHRIQ